MTYLSTGREVELECLNLQLRIEEIKLARARLECTELKNKLHRKYSLYQYSEDYSASESSTINTDAVWFHKTILPKLIPLVEYKGNNSMTDGIIINPEEISTEQQLVAYLYPIFNEIFREKCKVLNSEVYKWLPQSPTATSTGTVDSESTYYKPDLNLSTHAFYVKQFSTLGNEDVTYGVPPIQLLPHVLGILEAKTQPLGASQKGLFFKYLLSLLTYQKIAKGLIFNCTEGIYVEIKRSEIDSFEMLAYEHLPLQERGVKERIAELFNIQNPILFNVITRACAVLSNTMGSVLHIIEGKSFLGRGAYGYVFRLSDTGMGCSQYALKVVCTDTMRGDDQAVVQQYTRAEYDRVLWFNKQELFKDLFCRVVPGSFGVDTVHNSYIYYLMSEVGISIDISNVKHRRQAMTLLERLHQNGQVHGDARCPNMIMLSTGSFRFIDPRNYSPTFENYFSDLRSLIISMYHLSDEEFERTSAVLIACQQQAALEPIDKSYEVLFELCETCMWGYNSKIA